jgi:hypothetical protein
VQFYHVLAGVRVRLGHPEYDRLVEKLAIAIAEQADTGATRRGDLVDRKMRQHARSPGPGNAHYRNTGAASAARKSDDCVGSAARAHGLTGMTAGTVLAPARSRTTTRPANNPEPGRHRGRRRHDRLGAHRGQLGYCLGGLLAFLMAARRDIDASVGYYGVGIDNYLGEAAKAKRPVLLHIAEEDGFVSKESQARMKSGLTAANFTLHSYPGRDHALARVGGKHYHGQDSATANKRTLDFFAKHLC